MTKPMGPLCNLACQYCFYLEKARLFPGNENFKMPRDVLESYIRQYITQQNTPEINFAWQGGEPTLAGLDFFREVVTLQQKYGGGKRVFNALQTNGTLLDDQWCAFLAEQRFLVGLSVDGPPKLHNTYRVDKRGGPTYEQVAHGLKFLQKHGVEFNTLTVVNRANAQKPLEMYRFLKQLGSRHMQFIPLVERVADDEAQRLGLDFATPLADHDQAPMSVTPWSVLPKQYGEFLVKIFDEWVRHDVGSYYVQLFDVTLGNWLGEPGGLCVFNPTCGRALAMEHNGDVYSCDHYVYPRYKLGNLLDQSLSAMVSSEFQQNFGQAKSTTLPRYCRDCDVKFLCHGECPKHRFIRTPDGEPGLNYLCAAYQRFFRHSASAMQTMCDLLHARRAPAEIMQLQRQKPPNP
jgi:uncharacterized protein